MFWERHHTNIFAWSAPTPPPAFSVFTGNYLFFTITASMKWFCLLPLFFIFCCHPPAKAQLSPGIKAAPAQSWMKGHRSDYVDGLSVAFSFYRQLSPYIAIGMEPGLVQRGSGQYYGFAGGFIIDCLIPPCYYSDFIEGDGATMRTTWLQNPVLVKLGAPLAGNKFYIYVSAGGGISWLAGGYYDAWGYDENPFFPKQESRAIDFSKHPAPDRWDFGLHTRLGLSCR
ncbi:MAG TPA: hypothetical protein ENJ20_06345, partial [Bacteroidetes bacterium]|nr:hypothetical protein [Bacteroidota bacterium]